MVRRPQCRQENPETKVKIIVIMKIHYFVGVNFGTRVCTPNVGVNKYFGTRITKRLLPKLNYGIGHTKYNMGYYRQN